MRDDDGSFSSVFLLHNNARRIFLHAMGCSHALALSRFSPMVCFWVAGVSTDGGSRGAAEFGRQARGVRVSRKLATFSALGAHNWPDVTVGPSWKREEKLKKNNIHFMIVLSMRYFSII